MDALGRTLHPSFGPAGSASAPRQTISWESARGPQPSRNKIASRRRVKSNDAPQKNLRRTSRQPNPRESAREPKSSRIKIDSDGKVENPKGFQVGQGRPILTIWKIGKIARVRRGTCFPVRQLVKKSFLTSCALQCRAASMASQMRCRSSAL